MTLAQHIAHRTLRYFLNLSQCDPPMWNYIKAHSCMRMFVVYTSITQSYMSICMCVFSCLFVFTSFVGLRPLAPAVVVRISKESTGVLVQFKDDLEYISNPIRPFRGVYFSEVVA